MALKLTPKDLLSNKLIHGIIKEPLGGAHTNHEKIFKIVKKEIKEHLAVLMTMTPEERIEKRIAKFCSMGVVNEE